MAEPTSRRDFLSRTVAATAAASLASTLGAGEELLGDPRPLPLAAPRARLRPADPIRIGVIGTGGMGTAHVEGFVAAARDGRTEVRLVGLADVCEPRLLEARKKAEAVQGEGTVEVYPHAKALLAREDLHGVLIAAPEHWHAKLAEAAIKAGKDVYLEKPMTLRLKEALRLWDVQRKNPSVIVNVGTQFVMAPSYVTARSLIAEGAIGTPVWSQTSYCRNSKEGEWLYYAIDPAWQPGVNLDWDEWCGPSGLVPWSAEIYARWRRYRKYSTGIIGDLLVHRMAPLVMAVDPGWPVRVTGSGGHHVDRAMENHDQVNLTVEFERGHTMIVAGSTANELGLETVIRGHQGNLYVGGRNAVLRPERLFADQVEERTLVGEDHGDDQDAMRLRWLECIRTREPPPSPVELGAQIMVIVDLATRSMWEGGAFRYDPERRKVKKL